MNSLAVHAANSWSNNFISCPSARLHWPRGKALGLKDKGRGRGEEASKELWPSFLSISVARLSFMCAVSRDLKKQTEHYVKSKQWEQPSKTEYVVALVLQAWQQIQKSKLVIFYSVPLVLMLVCCLIFLKDYRGCQMTFSAVCSCFFKAAQRKEQNKTKTNYKKLCNTIPQYHQYWQVQSNLSVAGFLPTMLNSVLYNLFLTISINLPASLYCV